MSNNKGFSDTSANRYSLALYELASETDVISKVEANSNGLLKLILNNNEFKNLIKDPTQNQDTLNNVINKISENFNLEILFKNFLNFLVLKRRFFYVEQILKTFIEICSDKRGELKAKITSAKELSLRKLIRLKKNFR